MWQALVRSHGRARIADLARDAGWSPRTLERRFAEQIGPTPKTLARIRRVRRAVALLVDGTSPAAVAAACGFYDQPHLSLEVKAMTGLSPAALAAAYAAGVGAGARGGAGLGGGGGDEGPPLHRRHGHVTSILLEGRGVAGGRRGSP